MVLNLSAFLAIFPDFLIAGILSLIFYFEIRNLSIKRGERPVFILSRNDAILPGPGQESQMQTEVKAKSERQFFASLRSVQLAMLTVNIWILLTIILLPSSSAARLLPPLSLTQEYLLYSAMGAIFVTALLSTVIIRISNTLPRMLVTLGAIASGIFLIFYVPSMHWLSTYGILIRGTILYAIIASVLFLSYGFFTLPARKIEKVSIAGTFLAYVFTSAILFVNLIQSILI